MEARVMGARDSPWRMRVASSMMARASRRWREPVGRLIADSGGGRWVRERRSTRSSAPGSPPVTRRKGIESSPNPVASGTTSARGMMSEGGGPVSSFRQRTSKPNWEKARRSGKTKLPLHRKPPSSMRLTAVRLGKAMSLSMLPSSRLKTVWAAETASGVVRLCGASTTRMKAWMPPVMRLSPG